MPRVRLQYRERTGDYLTAATVKRGLSLKRLISACDFSERRLYMMKNDPGSIRLKELRQIDKELGLDDKELLEIVRGVW